MTYAIGDIHGCARALATLLDALQPGTADTLICLGDYIDRGPASRDVIDLLIDAQHTTRLIPLRGNHELHLRRAYTSDDLHDFFLSPRVGGTATVQSYGRTIHDIPQHHRDFLTQQTVLSHQTDTHIFVHGGLLPHLPLADHDERTLTSTRFHAPQPHCSGKTMVCGHTIQGDLPTRIADHSICIDTGAYAHGWLTAYHVETGTYTQTNEQAHLRTITLQ